MKTKYKARVGASFNNKEAQIIGEEITNLKNGQGHFTAKKMVESAKNKNSPLHEFFEWSNKKASENFRLHQARDIISHIVEIVVIEKEQHQQRSFFNVSIPNKGKVYVTLKEAMETPNYRKQLLNKSIVILENLMLTLKMFRSQD